METVTMEVPPATIGISLEAQTRGEIDMQIATARRYPRSIKGFLQETLSIATLDEDTAASCFYSKPQGGEMVTGPSARLAEMIASTWGHMRVEGRPVADDGRYVTARGTAWDLQNNVAIAFEVKRRVTNRQGARYSDDMVMTTTNAATSIALRNAVLKVIPSAFWRPIVDKCREVARGKAETLATTRNKMLAHFAKLGVSRERVFTRLDVRGGEDITLEHVELLRGLATAIKEGDSNIDDAFPLVAKMPDKAAPSEPPTSTLDRIAETLPPVQTANPQPFVDAATVSRDAARKQQTAAHEIPRAHRQPGEEG